MNETIETYNKAAPAYAAKFNSIGSREDDIRTAFVLCGKADPLVVEWGCGNGRDAAVILNNTQRYVGIDASEEMIHLAQAALPHADLRVADIAQFTIPVDTDIVFAFASLLHFSKEETAAILHKAHSRLADNAIIYISLKKAPYEKRIVTDAYGARTFYFYERMDIEEIAGEQYKTVFYEEQILKEVPWLTIAQSERKHE